MALSTIGSKRAVNQQAHYFFIVATLYLLPVCFLLMVQSKTLVAGCKMGHSFYQKHPKYLNFISKFTQDEAIDNSSKL